MKRDTTNQQKKEKKEMVRTDNGFCFGCCAEARSFRKSRTNTTGVP